MSYGHEDRTLIRRTIALQVAQTHQDHPDVETLLNQAEEIEKWLKRYG